MTRCPRCKQKRVMRLEFNEHGTDAKMIAYECGTTLRLWSVDNSWFSTGFRYECKVAPPGDLVLGRPPEVRDKQEDCLWAKSTQNLIG